MEHKPVSRSHLHEVAAKAHMRRHRALEVH
jgi:hypothetical protein